ncbi:MAG: GxxExxY protein [Desulfosporosinus sp.]|nr:GxxExxY protein [Desulfosporosinus sp.]
MERDSQTYAIIGAAMEVHRTLGPGFLEAVYQAAVAIELAEKGIPFQKEVLIGINYKGKELNCTYRGDYICYNEVLVELKSVSKMGVSTLEAREPSPRFLS